MYKDNYQIPAFGFVLAVESITKTPPGHFDHIWKRAAENPGMEEVFT